MESKCPRCRKSDKVEEDKLTQMSISLTEAYTKIFWICKRCNKSFSTEAKI